MSADFHTFESTVGHHVLAVDGSRIYDIGNDVMGADDDELNAMLVGARRYVTDEPLSPPPLRALSLNVAQGCNMSCSYCYADEGRFGKHARLMHRDVAHAAVDRLLAGIEPGEDAVLGYMGGEPFLNRDLIHETTTYAAREAKRRSVRLRFSVTTNATLLTDEDAELLATHPFSVAVSLDGALIENDMRRRMRAGGSAFQKASLGIAKLQNRQKRPKHVSIRATITPSSMELPQILDDLMAFGVDEVGFAPVLVSPKASDEFSEADFENFLSQMVECGTRCKTAILAGQRYPFSNFETAMNEIARGSHRPYSCGAAAGYASVSAEGALSACHRTIDDPAFAIGNLEAGPDNHRRAEFLAERHVLNQEPCRTCWARFLCGGGCHHEVSARGRKGCDYIRGWLDFCLSAYAELSSVAPAYFDDPEAHFKQTPGGQHV
ncbi:radical SAM protein [Parasphingorhabdus sp.]|uniref:radical SAM protein n=1 Tax=Parasphingorhabdus sp. TaxID=2709688 RepID=UPI003592EEAE